MESTVSHLRQVAAKEGRTRFRESVIHTTREEIWDAAKKDLEPLFSMRHNVRHFSEEPLDASLIEKALQMAQYTPSVCNRQAWRVYLFSDAESKLNVLKCQKGNRGFGHDISQVLLITCDLSWFIGNGERHQAWVDGGMYAMSVIYALHSLGLGTCCLNTSLTVDKEEKLRKAAGVPESEALIMMIAWESSPSLSKSHARAEISSTKSWSVQHKLHCGKLLTGALVQCG